MSENSLENLKSAITKNPSNRYYVDQLANAYARLKDWHKASNCYGEYLKINSSDAEGYFNYAYNLRFSGQYQQAILQYRKALALNISQPEEIHLNIAVILADYLRLEEQAIIELEIALKINNRYVSALYNLANLYEDSGNRTQAQLLFSSIINIEPRYYDALSRLAQIHKFSDKNDALITKLLIASDDKNIDTSTKINVYFALGKAFDNCGEYKRAFEYFEQANLLTQKITSSYSPSEHEHFVSKITEVFSSKIIDSFSAISDAEPVFICGMFRSGSTLVEQILAAHPKLTAGGEREFFIRLVETSLAPFPASILSTELEKFKVISKDYLADLAKAFPEAEYVIDKRPENYLFVGLIKILFPKARFIYTQRSILDNCLSVYFLRLGKRMNYALDLSHTAHYYQMQAQLMEFWQSKYHDSIHTVNYDELVKQPKKVIEQLLQFLNVDWDDNCLSFHQVKNKVKTASVWQVRQPLYSTSSGRWKNYKKFISVLLNNN